MTQDELSEKLAQIRLNAFGLALKVAKGQINPVSMGYLDKADACMNIILEAGTEIERLLKKWEKDNPL